MRRQDHVSLASIVFLAIFARPPSANVVADEWFAEFEPAQAAAKEQGKDLLIDFGGSDWCTPCRTLKERILNKPEFIELAQEHFVLVDIDDLHGGEMPEGRKQRYQALQKEYRVETFPSVVLATPEGKPYAWATYVPSINEPEEYWKHLEPLRKRGVAFRELFRQAGGLAGAARAASLIDALSAIRADFAVRYYAKEILEVHDLDPDDESGYLAFLQGRHDVEALQEQLHKVKSNWAEIEESAAQRAQLDAITKAVDELIDGGKLRGEALQEALLLRAVLQVRVREPWKALETLEALLAAQATHTRFDRGDFMPLDAKSIKTVSQRIASGKQAAHDLVGQYFALHRIFEFELPDRYEHSCGHGFRPGWLARGWIGEEYCKLLIRSTAELPPARRAKALRDGLDGTRFAYDPASKGSVAEIDRLLPRLKGTSGDEEESPAAGLDNVEAKADEGDDAKEPGKNGRAGGDGDKVEADKPIPLHKRWEIRFPEEFTVDDYAQGLDFFEIELGTLAGAGEVIYLSHLAQPKPDTRRGKSKDEFRLYMSWRSGKMKHADKELLKRAGVPPAKIVLQFYPDKTEQALLQLEHDYGKRPAAAIAKTRFGIRKSDDGFEFYVVEQTVR